MESLEAYGSLIDCPVTYIKQGNKRCGILRSIGFSITNELMARVEKNIPLMKKLMGGSHFDEVPLIQVELPSSFGGAAVVTSSTPVSGQNDAHAQAAFQCESMQTSCHQPPQTPPSTQNLQQPQYFSHDNITYQSCFLSELSLGEEVVWLLPEKSQPCRNPYIGKVSFIGKHTSVTGVESFITIVRFDQDTSHLPGSVARQLGQYSNIIHTSDLLKLSVWLSICQQPEAGTDFNYDRSEKPNLDMEPDLMDFDESFSGLSIHDQPKGSKTDEGWKRSIDLKRFIKLVTFPKGRYLGIQGKNSSCYMDACLFSLFAFNHTLDELISVPPNHIEEISDSVKAVLRNNIIQPLRREYFVDFSKTHDLRQILATGVDPKFHMSFMDAEDFLISFLQVLNAPPMFEYDNGTSDYVHQIFLRECNVRQKFKKMNVQLLVQSSFNESGGLKLRKPPSGLFIIKLPVSNGKLIPCERVLPNLQLDLSTILSPNRLEGTARPFMNLSGVICFRHSHYTAFVRTGKDILSPWVFMNSNPTTGKPEVVLLQHMGEIIEYWSIYDGACENFAKEFSSCNGISEIEMSFADQLTRDAFICIYDKGT